MRGLSQSDLSRRAEVDRRLLSRLLKGDQETIRDEDAVARIARALSTTVEWLNGSVPDPDLPARRMVRAQPPSDGTVQRETHRWIPDAEEIVELSAETEAYEAELWRLREAPPEAFFLHKLSAPLTKELAVNVRHGSGGRRGPVPVFGDGSETDIRLGHVSQTIERPPLLYGRIGAYALVAGPGLEPRYRQGEVLYVAPRLPLCVLDWVVAITVIARGTDSSDVQVCEAKIYRLVRLMRSGAELRVPNSDSTVTIPLSDLWALHRIVMAGDRTLAAQFPFEV